MGRALKIRYKEKFTERERSRSPRNKRFERRKSNSSDRNRRKRRSSV